MPEMCRGLHFTCLGSVLKFRTNGTLPAGWSPLMLTSSREYYLPCTPKFRPSGPYLIVSRRRLDYTDLGVIICLRGKKEHGSGEA